MTAPRHPSIAEHLAAIRRIPPSRTRWAWSSDVRTPSGLIVPAQWMLDEYPELNENPLPPFLEACFEAGRGTRWGRSAGVAGFSRLLSITGFLTLMLMVLAVPVRLLGQWNGYTLPGAWVFGIPFFVMMTVTAIYNWRKKGRRVPTNPATMLFCKDKNFQREVSLIPLNGRDYFLGESTYALGKTQSGWLRIPGHVAPYLLLGILVLVLLFLQDGWSILPPAIVLAGYADFFIESRAGAITAQISGVTPLTYCRQWLMMDRATRCRNAFRGTSCFQRLGRRFSRSFKRFLRDIAPLKGRVASVIFGLPMLPLLLLGPGLVGVLGLALSPTLAIPVAILYFLLARSPLATSSHRLYRYRARLVFAEMEPALGYNRRRRQRLENSNS